MKIKNIFSPHRQEKQNMEETKPAEQQEKQKETDEVAWFKRMMAHNVRMPLAIISGYGELLLSGSIESREEELKYIQKICQNIDFLTTVTQVLLDNNAGEPLEQMENFDVLACIYKVADYVRIIAQKAGIGIVINSSQNAIWMMGNRILMMRALYNLLENSFLHMKRQGEIYITADETPEEILIVYRDDGRGMSEAAATELSKQLEETKEAFPREAQGIGMYMIREMVEKHNGTLTVKTEQGHGMEIYMSFPKTNL